MKPAYLSPALLATLGTTALAVLAALAVARSPGLSESLLWRADAWQPPPSLTQRVFERRLTVHQLDQDRLLPSGAVLFFGDSHLSILPAGGIFQAYNFAIGGESAQRLALRLPHYRSLRQARAIVLGTGTNDLLEGRSPAQVESAWAALLRQMPTRARVVCVGLPRRPGAAHAGAAAAYEEADRRIAALCHQSGHAFVPLSTDEGNAGPVPLAADGLHLRAEASRQLLARIEDILKVTP